MNNELYLRRRRRVFVAPGSGESAPELVAALLKNIESLGFTLSLELQARVATLSLQELEAFYADFTTALRALVGAHVQWKPFYPDFPAQVMEMSEAKLYLNALVHYLTNQRIPFVKQERDALDEETRLKIIDLGGVEDFEAIFREGVGAKTSISSADKDDVRWFVAHYKDEVVRLMPAEIANRETLAFVGAALLQETMVGAAWVRSKVTTATDVLRLAVALHGGDVSLASRGAATKAARVQQQMLQRYAEINPQAEAYIKQMIDAAQAQQKARAELNKFGKFSRARRKLLLQLLEDCPNAIEDMLRWQELWVRLGERLHPGEWAKRFPQTFAAFEVVRGNTKFVTFNGSVEAALRERDGEKAIALLQTRPGDFARRLDHLLRLYPTQDETIVESLSAVADRVSTPVLLQLLTHFKHRAQPHDLRIFFPKGEVTKVWGQKETLAPLDAALCETITARIAQVLTTRFATLPPLGPCFLDAELKNYLVPFSQRSASKTLRTLARGSRLTLPDANTLRFFLWWRNGRERTDLDLSAAIYGADFVYQDVISYYNLKNYGGHHSGDIVDAPQGAAEFIDLNCAKMLEKGARYVVMSVNSYTEQPYCDLPECFAGWMAREKPNSGEIFEPRTVQDRIDLSADTKICLPMVIDLETRTVVWMDLALRDSPAWNNVANNLRGVSLMLRAMLGLEKTTLYDLFALHITARGEWAEDRAEATQIFSVTDGLTPFDLDTIASQWM